MDFVQVPVHTINHQLLKKLIRKALQTFGYDIVKYKPPFIRGKLDRASVLTEFKWLQDYRFGSIIDIGANEGQFSDKMRILFPDARVYAFEPLPHAYEALQNNFKNDSRFLAINTGLGASACELDFWENDYSPSSSFLSLADSHKVNFKDAFESKKIKVRIVPLDDALANKPIDPPILVKIDVQGYEDQVIQGGKKVLQMASVIICEVSFVELYKGQPLFSKITQLFNEWGFEYAGNIEQICSPDTNQILQADGIFIKQS